MKLSFDWIGNDERVERYCMLVVLGCAFLIRFYHLETPSMWDDELFAPVMASKPFGYLVRWIFVEDVHPPLFYLFLKINLLFGHSDFALRVVPAALGTVSVWLCIRLGSGWIGSEGGLLAGAFLAISPAHLYISRVVRFYSFTTFLVMLALLVLKRIIDRWSERDVLYIMILGALLVLSEYTSIVPVFALLFCTLVVALKRENRAINLWYMIRVGSTCFAVPLVFLVVTAINRSGYSGVSTSSFVFTNVLRAIRLGMMGYIREPGGTASNIFLVAFMALLAVGAIRLLAHEKRLFAICTVFLASPFLILMLIRPGYCLAFWHIFYLYPIFSLLGAAGMQVLLKGNGWRLFFAFGMSLVGATLYLWPLHAAYYELVSYNSDAKNVAKTLVGGIDAGSASLVDTNDFDMINWYVDQFGLENRLIDQEVFPSRDHVILNLFTVDGKLGHLVTSGMPVQSWAQIKQEKFLGRTTLVKASISSTPEPELPMTGVPVEMPAFPSEFYGKVYWAKGVMIDPYWGKHIIPTKNNTWSKVKYRLVNVGDAERSLVTVKVDFANKGVGNIVKANYAFDNEELHEWLISNTVEIPTVNTSSNDPYLEKSIVLRREKPFHTIDVEVLLYCAGITPKFPTSNLDRVALHKVSVSARPLSYDLMDMKTYDPLYVVSGMKDPESGDSHIWRWAMGSRQAIVFNQDSPRRLRFSYAFNNPFNGQSFELIVNGKRVGGAVNISRQNWMQGEYENDVTFEAMPGENRIEFAFKKINHVNDSFSETDNTPYVAAFTKLRIEPVSPK